MRHLFVTRAIYPAQVGGPANTVHEFSRVDERVDVISSDRGMTNELLHDHKLKIGVFNNIDGSNVYLYKSYKQHPLTFQFIFWLIKNIKKYQYIHVHSFFAPSSLVAILISLITRTKFIIYPHGELFEPALKVKKVYKSFFLKVFSPLYRKSSAFVVTSNEEKEAVLKRFPVEIVQIKNGISLNDYKVNSKIGSYFLYIGRIDPIKNLESLIQAYYLYLSEDLRYKHKLFIVGTGSLDYVDRLKIIVEELKLTHMVKFLGHKTGKEKTIIYQNCLATILPSKSENFGNVIMESLAYGRPVIASDGTPWSDVEIYNCGFYVGKDPQQIRSSLLMTSSLKEEEFRLMSLNARDYAERFLSVDSIVPYLIEEVERL